MTENALNQYYLSYCDWLKRRKVKFKIYWTIREWRIKHPNDLNTPVGVENIKWEHSKPAKEKG